ncbi:MAG TPA: lysophospholipid acyltransferase family protein [Mycobacteriales bacterium]|nr:lysophospholipid acyltransferase family protein [Mycobacteriales bacterium]
MSRVTTVRPVRHERRSKTNAAVATACRLVGGALARALFAVRVEGAEHVPAHEPVVLAGNHTGFLDGPLVFLLAPRRTGVLAKAEIFVGPWPRLWARLDVVPVHRGTPDRAALRAGLAVLTGGGALTVFPEGTRGSGSLDSVTDGVAWLALRSGADVVPVALSGTAQALPRGTWRPRLRTPVTIRFGAPLRIHPVGDPRARSTVRTAAEQIRAHLLRHVSASAS